MTYCHVSAQIDQHIPFGSPYGYESYLGDMKNIIASYGCTTLMEAMEVTKGHLPYDLCQKLLDRTMEVKKHVDN